MTTIESIDYLDRHTLRHVRISRNLTLRQVEAQTGITSSNLCNFETGKRIPTLQTLYKLCKFYKLPSRILLRF